MAVSVADLAQGGTVSCPHGHDVTFHQEGHDIAGLDTALGDLEQTLKEAGRKLRRTSPTGYASVCGTTSPSLRSEPTLTAEEETEETLTAEPTPEQVRKSKSEKE